MIKPLSEKAVHTRIAGRQNLAAASNVWPAFDSARRGLPKLQSNTLAKKMSSEFSHQVCMYSYVGSKLWAQQSPFQFREQQRTHDQLERPVQP
jgi:hypothetical protein